MSDTTIPNPGNPPAAPGPFGKTDAELASMLGLAPAAEPAPETPDEPAPAPEPVAEDEQDPGDETPEQAPETTAKPAPDAASTINVERVTERLFGLYSMATDAVDAMDDKTRLETADRLARKVLERARIPKRFIEQMTPAERVAEAIPHRVEQRNMDRGRKAPQVRNELNGDSRTAAPQTPAVAPEVRDPLSGVADEVDSLDPELGAKLKAGAKGVHDELAAAKRELARLQEFRRSSNFADAFVTVLEESPGLRGQHQAIREAMNDLPDGERMLEVGGTELVELVRRAAEDFGYVQQGPAKAPPAPAQSRARNTPPKPSARGGSGRTSPVQLTPQQEMERREKALMAAGFDESKAWTLLREGKF